jgi:hypothetical protein
VHRDWQCIPVTSQAVGCIAQQAASANGAAADGAAKAGRQLYVGAQALGYRRDNMEVWRLLMQRVSWRIFHLHKTWLHGRVLEQVPACARRWCRP